MLHPLTPAFYIPIVHGRDCKPYASEYGSTLVDMISAIDNLEGNYGMGFDKLVAVFCVEGQKATDVSETVAKAWLKANESRVPAMNETGLIPEFVVHNAGDELDAILTSGRAASADYANMIAQEGRIYRASVL